MAILVRDQGRAHTFKIHRQSKKIRLINPNVITNVRCYKCQGYKNRCKNIWKNLQMLGPVNVVAVNTPKTAQLLYIYIYIYPESLPI